MDWSGFLWAAADSSELATPIGPACACVAGRLLVAVALAALGLWCLLALDSKWTRRGGVGLAAGGVLLMASQLQLVQPWGDWLGFWLLAALAVLPAAAMIVSHRPVYSAIWFAVSLLGVASLLLWQGAQFLGLATMVVYAGAIVVTFLFVLMLALPAGYGRYDRISWGKLPVGVACLVASGLVGLCVWGLSPAPGAAGESPWQLAKPASTGMLSEDLLHPAHVAHLGSHLFTEYLLAIELAGVLLLMALVGAVSWMAQAQRYWQVPGDGVERTDHV